VCAVDGVRLPIDGRRWESIPSAERDIMSARENLSALLATRGKGGSLESITQAGQHFSKDKTLTPSDFISAEKLDASKAITLLGGYVVSQYGIAPKDAYAMRNVFAKEYRQVLPLFELDKAMFISSIDEIEGEIATREANKTSLEASLGTDAERYIKNAQSNVDKVVDANISPKVRHDLLTLIASAQRKLEYGTLKVAQNA
jgi:hypothetical protein